jgi:hypothetical protein
MEIPRSGKGIGPAEGIELYFSSRNTRAKRFLKRSSHPQKQGFFIKKAIEK